MNLGQKGGLPLVETEYSIAQLISYLKTNNAKTTNGHYLSIAASQ